jgi:hypothetical protein
VRDDGGEGALVAGDQYERAATAWFLVWHVRALALAVPTASLEKERGTEATVNYVENNKHAPLSMTIVSQTYTPRVVFALSSSWARRSELKMSSPSSASDIWESASTSTDS